MGAKTWMLVHAHSSAKDALAASPVLVRDASRRLAQTLFPNDKLEPIDDGDLSNTCPPDSIVYAGDFGAVKIVAAHEFSIDYPSILPTHFISPTGTTTLHAMHSVVDWFAFAHWSDGQLIRSLSLSPDSGILEDKGECMPFELPYWNGEHPVTDEQDMKDYEHVYPFVFHPLDLGEAALMHFFGYQLEGYYDENMIEPEDFPLLGFKRARQKPWWRFW